MAKKAGVEVGQGKAGAVAEPVMERQVIALLAQTGGLEAVLEAILRSLEAQQAGSLCSILLLDDPARPASNAVASPMVFRTPALDGVAISPSLQSRGLASTLAGQRGAISDLQSNAAWEGAWDVARQAGLAACWSEPILGASSRTVGALAMFHREARLPTEDEIVELATAARLAALAIDRDQTHASPPKAKVSDHPLWVDMAEDIAGVGHWQRDTKTGQGFWSDEMYRIYGLDPADGVPSAAKLASLYPPEDRAILAEIARGDGQRSQYADNDYRIIRPDGEIRHLAARASVERNPDGTPRAIYGVVLDVTKAKRAEQVLRESEARYRLLAENATDIIAKMDLDGVITFITPASERVLARAPETLVGQRLWDLIHPDDAVQVLPLIQNHIAAGPDAPALVVEYRLRRQDGDWAWIEGQPKVLFDAAGAPTSLQDALRDIGERKAAEERQALMVNELNHRVKNTLAIMQSIAMQTQKSTEAPPSFVKAFNARILALSHSHDLLSQNAWSGAWVRELVAEHLRPYRALDRERFSLAGPDARVSPKAAVALGMALGELATNAAKYGALSAGQGLVHVTWDLRQQDERPWLHLVWRELGGPQVQPPDRQGFGRRLIERGLAHELGGQVRMLFEPGGVVCQMDFPLVSPGGE